MLKKHYLLQKPHLLWLLFFILGVTAIGLTKYRSHSFDSQFYGKLVTQLSTKPISGWLTPKWDAHYGHTKDEYIRDHLIGHLIPAVILSQLGIPGPVALHAIQLIYYILSLYLLTYLAGLYFGRRDSLAILWALQIIPMAFSYGIRANHERAVLFYMLIAVIGSVKMANHLKWCWITLIGIVAIFLIKGIFFLPIMFFSLLVFAISLKNIFSKKAFYGLCFFASSILVIIGVGYLYEHLFFQQTGLSFFEGYWSEQISDRIIKAEQSSSIIFAKLHNLKYYIGRTLYYSFPWSILALIFLWKKRSLISPYLKNLHPKKWIHLEDYHPLRGAMIFNLIVFGHVLMFSLSNRTASRYLYPAYLVLAAISIVYLVRHSTKIQKFHEKVIELGVHKVAACIWFFTFVAHIINFLMSEVPYLP